MQIIKMAIATIDIILAILMFFFTREEDNGGIKSFFAFLIFLLVMNATLIYL